MADVPFWTNDILFNAINQVNPGNPSVTIRYRQINQDVDPIFQRHGVITNTVRHLGDALYRQYNYENMMPQEVHVSVAHVGSSVRDGPVTYYHSPVHGIVRIYYHNEWIFHEY